MTLQADLIIADLIIWGVAGLFVSLACMVYTFWR